MDTDIEPPTEELTREEKLAAKKALKKAVAAEKARLKELREHAAQQDLKRDEFKREKAFVSSIYERAADDWEKLVMDVSHKADCQELDALWATMTHTMDRKSNLIERLTQNVEHSQEQYKRLAVSHLQFIDYSNS